MLSSAQLMGNNVTEKSINLVSLAPRSCADSIAQTKRRSSMDEATTAATSRGGSSRCGWRERHAHTSTSRR